MFRIHLFSIFIIKTPVYIAALALLCLLIVKTLTNVLVYIQYPSLSQRALADIKYPLPKTYSLTLT